jgi:ceramide glucosyltransferase
MKRSLEFLFGYLPSLSLKLFNLGEAIALIGVVLITIVYFWHRALSKSVTTQDKVKTKITRYPSITVVRPVRGKDVGAAENFAAALDTGYPGEVETLFVFDDDHDPGLPVAREVVANHRASGRPGTADVIVAGSPPPGRTGKLNAMVVGQRFAHNELVAFGDSDTRPDRHVLRATVDALLTTQDAGSAFAPIVIHQPPRALGDVVYMMMQNSLYAPLASWASGAERELPFIMGQLMVFKREALTAIGGVETAQGQLVDDMYIGKRVHEVGYKNVMTRQALHIATGGMTLKEFLPVYGRWMMFSKNGLPTSFVWPQWVQGAGFFIALLATLAGLVSGHALAAILPALAIVAQSMSLLQLNRDNGGAEVPLKWTIAPAVFFLVSPFVLAKNALKKTVMWRGRSYNVGGANAALAPAPAAQQTFSRAA